MKRVFAEGLIAFLGLLQMAGCAVAPRPGTGTSFEAARQSLARVDPSNDAVARTTARAAAMRSLKTTEQEQQLATAFNGTLGACQSVLTGFESKANKLRMTKVVIATIEAIAGAIVVPAVTAASATANAVWISAPAAFPVLRIRHSNPCLMPASPRSDPRNQAEDARQLENGNQRLLRTGQRVHGQDEGHRTSADECTLYGITLPVQQQTGRPSN